jgi:hypothetical protein
VTILDPASVEALLGKQPTGPLVAPFVWQDPGRQLSRLRTFDIVDFGVSFVFGLATTFLVLYMDKNFGTGWQYLAAVATGFATTTVVLQLLPWYRQYRIDPAPEKASAT